MKNNPEIQSIVDADQADRAELGAGKIDKNQLWKRDRPRLLRIVELHNQGAIQTAIDHRNAALVCQHGINDAHERDLSASDLALKLMKKAIELDPQMHKWLLAAIIDRNLMIRKEPQIYGTQYLEEHGVWKQYAMDEQAISDEERKSYYVEPLSDQKEKVIRLNKKRILERYFESKGMEEISAYCKEHYQGETSYDLTWQGLSEFCFQLKRLGKRSDMLLVFRLAVELYPKEYDLHHSLGLELAAEGQIEEAIQYLEKTIKLNPMFETGRRDLEKLKNSIKNK